MRIIRYEEQLTQATDMRSANIEGITEGVRQLNRIVASVMNLKPHTIDVRFVPHNEKPNLGFFRINFLRTATKEVADDWEPPKVPEGWNLHEVPSPV